MGYIGGKTGIPVSCFVCTYFFLLSGSIGGVPVRERWEKKKISSTLFFVAPFISIIKSGRNNA